MWYILAKYCFAKLLLKGYIRTNIRSIVSWMRCLVCLVCARLHCDCRYLDLLRSSQVKSPSPPKNQTSIFCATYYYYYCELEDNIYKFWFVWFIRINSNWKHIFCTGEYFSYQCFMMVIAIVVIASRLFFAFILWIQNSNESTNDLTLIYCYSYLSYFWIFLNTWIPLKRL